MSDGMSDLNAYYEALGLDAAEIEHIETKFDLLHFDRERPADLRLEWAQEVIHAAFAEFTSVYNDGIRGLRARDYEKAADAERLARILAAFAS